MIERNKKTRYYPDHDVTLSRQHQITKRCYYCTLLEILPLIKKIKNDNFTFNAKNFYLFILFFEITIIIRLYNRIILDTFLSNFLITF